MLTLPDALPSGVTRSPPTAEEQKRRFASACLTVARATGAKVWAIARLGIQNYEIIGMEHPDCRVDVLCNHARPWLAFAAPGQYSAGNRLLTFVDAPGLAAAFAALTDFLPLERADLELAPSKLHLAALDAHVRKDIRYWRPDRLGDVIFNFWD